MKKIILCLLVFALAGCQSAAKFQQTMLSWKGQPISSLTSSWGYPNGELTSPDGNKVYVYSHSGSYVVPQTTNYYGNSNLIGNSVYSTGSAYTTGGYAVSLSCTVYVEFGEDKIIKNISWRGNNCVA